MEDLEYKNCEPFVPSFPGAKVKVIKVYDGDTCHVGYINPEGKGVRHCCRLYGIDTPELRTRDAEEKAAGYVAKKLLVDACLGKIVNIRVRGLDKYGRVLAEFSTETIPDLSQYMISTGLAVRYEGGRKAAVDWGGRHRIYEEGLGSSPENSPSLPE